MWIARTDIKNNLKQTLLNLDKKILILQGARQVGKTALVNEILSELNTTKSLKVNLLYPSTTYYPSSLAPVFGRDFYGSEPTGIEFIENIKKEVGDLQKLDSPVVIFVDEVDRHPVVMESIQLIAEYSSKLKFIFSGSGLENLNLQNASTGRKTYFNLYPITFTEFLNALGEKSLLTYLLEQSPFNKNRSDYYDNLAEKKIKDFIKVGGMPRLVSCYVEDPLNFKGIITEIQDLAISIEENVKLVLGEKSKLYEYEDVLRKICLLSLDTLKFTKLQVQSAGRSEAKKIVNKTVGARVAHQIRLWENGDDLSKYIIFDSGIANYLLAGSNLLNNKLSSSILGILHETFVGNSLIHQLGGREDLKYWKSDNKAEVDFAFRTPYFAGIDVKTSSGTSRSLSSLAIFEKDVDLLVMVTDNNLSLLPNHIASVPNSTERNIKPLLFIPHFLMDRCVEIGQEVLGN